MFDNLSNRLGGIFDRLRGKKLTEEAVNEAMREIRIALLEADVALPVVKQFVSDVKEKAVGQEIIKGVNPVQQVVKIVNDQMVEMLGGGAEDAAEIDLKLDAKPPVVFLMVGLQGSGKTTSTAKIGRFLSKKHSKRVLMASLDTQRPAAQEQLATLGQQTEVETLEIVKGENPVQITKRALAEAKKGSHDVLILDTAGRLAINAELMNEVKQIRDLSNPTETLLVVDAMTGQDAVNTAREFNEQIGITGTVLTRIDGDSRGGAAMSMKAVTGKPIKLLGVGEKWDAIEAFDPKRITGRILGMGDVVGLVEKAIETIDQDEAAKMAKKFSKGNFDLNDFQKQLQQMRNMGGMGGLAKMIPGMGKMMKKIEEADVENTVIKKQEAILSSMTVKEKAQPKLLNASRKRRIAAGSGTSVQDINKLMKQFTHMQKMMKQMKKMGMGGMMKAMKGIMGDQGMNDLVSGMAGAEGLDPKALKALEQQAPDMADQGPLGVNPFTSGGGLPGLGGMNLPPELMGLAQPTTRGGSKKNRKKKKR